MINKRIALNSILLAIGLLLHQVEPAIFGVKPDMTLIMLFTIMILNRDSYKTCLICGVITGIFSALTTAFPGGQLPNLIDKFVTVNIMYVVMTFFYGLPFISKMKKKKRDSIVSCVLMSVGTIVSGFTFLYTAQMIIGLPGGINLSTLFATVVIPAVFINFIVGMVVFKAAMVMKK